MYFTTEDYKKIERWLQLRTKKDSDFKVAKTLTGKESIPILQDNENKLTTINEITKGLTINNITDFFNVTAYNNADYSDLVDAVSSVPNTAKKIGLVISYRKNNVWYIAQYRGANISTWEDTTYWDDLFTGIHKDIEYLYKEVNSNTTNIKDIGDTITTLSEKVSDSATDIELLKDNADSTGKKLKELSGLVESNAQGILDTNTNLDNLIKSTNNKIDEVATKVDGNTSDIITIQQQVKTLKEDHNSLKSDVSTNAVNISNNTTSINTLTDSLTTTNSNVTNLKTTVSAIADKQKTIGDQAATNTGNITTLQAQVGKLKEDQTSLKEDVSTNATNISSNTDSINTLNTTIGNTNKEVSTLKTTTSAIADKQKTIGDQVVINTEDITTLKAQVQDVKTNQTSMKSDISTNSTNISNNTTSIGNLSTTIGNTNKEVSTLKTTVSAIGDKQKVIGDQVVTNADDISTLKTQVKDLQDSGVGDISELTKKVNTNTTDIGLLKDNAEATGTKLKEVSTTADTAAANATTALNTANTNASDITTIKSEQTTQNNNIASINTRLTPTRSGQYLKGALKQGILTTYWEDISFATSADIESLEGAIETNSTNISTNTKNIAKVKLTAEGAEQTAAEVEERLNSAYSDMSAIITELGNVDTRVTNAEDTIKTHTTSINSINTKISAAETAANKTTNITKSTTIAGFIANVDSKIGTLSTSGGSSLPSPDRVNQVFMSDYNAEGTSIIGQWKDFNMDEVIGYGIKFKNSLLPTDLPTTYPAGNQSLLAELPVQASMKACVYRPKTKELMYWLDPNDWGFAEGVKDNFFKTGISVWKQKMWSTLSKDLGCSAATYGRTTRAVIEPSSNLAITLPISAVDAPASRFFVGMKVRAWQYKTTGTGLNKKRELEGMIGESKIINIVDSTIYIDKQLLGTQLNGQATSTGLTIINAKLAKDTTVFEWGSRLDGYDGEVMIYVPTFYIKGSQDPETNMRTVLVAPVTSKYYNIINTKSSGWNKVTGFMLSAYLCTTLNESPGSNMGYLSTFTSYPVPLSIKNTNTYCRGGADGTNSSKDLWLSSYSEFTDLGKPINGLIRSKIRDAAQNNAKTTLMTYEVFRSLLYLYAIERKDILFSNLVTANTDIPYRQRYQTIPPIGYLNSFANSTVSTSVPTHAWDNSGDGYDNNPSNVPSTTKNYKVNKFRGLEYPIEVGHYMLDDYSYNSNTKIFQALTGRTETNSFLEGTLDYSVFSDQGWGVETSNVEATTSTKKFTAFLDDSTHLSILPASTVAYNNSGRSALSIAQGTLNTNENNVVNIGTIYDSFFPFSATVTPDGVVPTRGGYFRTMIWQITTPQIALHSDDTTLD